MGSEEFQLEVAERQESGSRAARRLRRDGFVPAVIYGKGGESRHVTVNLRAFRHLAKKSLPSQVFTLVDPSRGATVKALVKDIQKHYTPAEVTHIDFLELVGDQLVKVRVPVHIRGEAPGVKLQGGVLTVVAHEIVLRCRPDAIPQAIDLDVSGLKLGDSLHARDLKLPEGVEFVGTEDESLVSVNETRTGREESTATAEGAAGAAAEGASS